MPDPKNTERVREWRKRQRSNGLELVTVHIPAHRRAELLALAEKWRVEADAK